MTSNRYANCSDENVPHATLDRYPPEEEDYDDCVFTPGRSPRKQRLNVAPDHVRGSAENLFGKVPLFYLPYADLVENVGTGSNLTA